MKDVLLAIIFGLLVAAVVSNGLVIWQGGYAVERSYPTGLCYEVRRSVNWVGSPNISITPIDESYCVKAGK